MKRIALFILILLIIAGCTKLLIGPKRNYKKILYCLETNQTELNNYPSVTTQNCTDIISVQFWLTWEGGEFTDSVWLHKAIAEHAIVNSWDHTFALSWVSPAMVPVSIPDTVPLATFGIGYPFLKGQLSKVEFGRLDPWPVEAPSKYKCK